MLHHSEMLFNSDGFIKRDSPLMSGNDWALLDGIPDGEQRNEESPIYKQGLINFCQSFRQIHFNEFLLLVD
jgi:hypothetical protein